MSVDEALFDGRTLYARVTVDLEEWDGTAIVPAPQRYAGMTIDELADSRLSDYDLAVSFRVNGAEQALITGWASAGDATCVRVPVRVRAGRRRAAERGYV